MATPDPDRLTDELVDAIADGEEVDWSSAERRAGPGRRELVRNLRAISELSRPSWREASGGTPTPLSRAGLRRMPRWRAAVLWLASVQLCAGLLSFALFPTPPLGFPAIFPFLGVLAFGVAAAWLLVGGRDDARAANLAGVFLCLGAAAGLTLGAPLWDATAGPGRLLGRALLPEAFMPAFLWAFVREFPRPHRLSAPDRWIRLGARAAVAVGVVLFLANLSIGALATRAIAAPAWAGALGRGAGAYWLLSFGAALPALPLALLRAGSAGTGERRRLALFLWGLAFGLGPVFLVVLLEETVEPFRAFTAGPEATLWAGTLVYGFAMTVPFTTAWSVVAHRVLEVRILLQRAALAALARRSLWVAMLGPLAGLLVHLYVNRERPVADVVGTLPGALLAVAVGVSIVLMIVRDPLLRALNRLLFREEVDWQGALSRTNSQIRMVATARQLEDSLAEHLDRAVNAGSVHLYLTSEDGRSFAPLGRAGPRLSTGTALARVVAAGETPVVTAPGDERSIWPWLPTPDREWLQENGLGLLAPFVSSRGEVAGMIGLGPKQASVPYSDDDCHFVAAVATSVALVMETKGLWTDRDGDAAAATAFECRDCGEVYREGAEECACGGRLTGAQLPWTVNGKFRLRRVLGRGGMGVVYLADDVDLGRRVALKTLPRLLPRAADRLRKEARSMAALEHPNLAQIYGLESWRGVPVLVVEHLAGGTLAARARRPWPWREAVGLGVQIGGALTAMHAHGLVHRDVKPSNIGYTAKEVPKLLDFGLARIELDAEAGRWDAPFDPDRLAGLSDHELAGTPLYVPPADPGGRATPSSQDLWAVALVVYELIAGRHPFAGRLRPGDLARGRLPAVPDLRALRGDCPPRVAEWLAIALAADATLRPTTAAALTGALEDLLASSD